MADVTAVKMATFPTLKGLWP